MLVKKGPPVQTERFVFKDAAQQDRSITVAYRDIEGQCVFESIHTSVTMQERQALLRQLVHPGATAATAPYTYLMQNHLAAFQGYATLQLQQYHYDAQKSDVDYPPNLRKKIKKILQLQQLMNDIYDFSRAFVPFEQLLNDEALNPTQKFQQLQECMATFETCLKQKLAEFEQHHQHNALIMNAIHVLRPVMNKKIQRFKSQLNAIPHPISQQTLQGLLALQHQPHHLSLGVWMGECMRELLDMGIKTAKAIQGERLSELAGIPHGVSELSDAKFSVELKMSISGAETVDAQAKTSSTLIEQFLQEDHTLQHLAQFKLQRLDEHTTSQPLEKETIYLSREKDEIHYQFFNAQGLLIAGIISQQALEPTNAATLAQLKQLRELDKLTNDELKQRFLTLYPEIRRPLNLTPYLANWNMASMINLLRLLSNEDGHQAKRDEWLTRIYQFFSQGPPAFIAVGSLVLLVSLAEALIAITRFSFTLLVLTPLYYLTFKWSGWLTLDNFLSEQHERLSDAILLKRVKHWWNALYQSDLKPSWQKIMAFFNQPISEFQQLLARALSLESISHFIEDIGHTFTLFFTRLYQQIIYMTEESHDKETFERVLEHQSIQIQLFDAYDALLDSLKNNPSAKAHPDLFPDVVLNPRNTLKLPTALISSMVSNYINQFIIPKFHKLPGFATTYFAMSCGAFMSYVPSLTAISLIKSLATYFSIAPNWVGIQLFSHLPRNILEQSVSLMMFWRLGMMSSELMVEMYKGHYHYLTTLLDNPEELVIHLTSILGIGFGLQYLPPLPDIDIPLVDGRMLPNYFFALVNWFIDEAVKRPSRIITVNYGLLGLEFAIVLNAFTFEDTQHQPIQKSAFNAFMQGCIQAELLSQSEPQLSQTFEKLCQTHLPHLNAAQRQLFLEKVLYVKNDPAAHKKVSAMNQVQHVFTQLPTIHQPKPLQPVASPNSTPPSPYPPATQALMETLAILQNPNTPLHLNANLFKEAYPMYDQLNQLFDQYHEEEQQRAQQENRPAVLLDKKLFLQQFYHQYCDARSNDLRRTITMICFYVIPTLPWRGIQWLYGHYNQKKALQEKVKQSFMKDRLMVMQILSNLITAIKGAGLAITSLLRGLVFGIPILTLEFINLFRPNQKKPDDSLKNEPYSPSQAKVTWLDQLYAMANQFALHKIDWVPQWYRAMYVHEISQVSEARSVQQTAKMFLEHLQQQQASILMHDSTLKIDRQLGIQVQTTNKAPSVELNQKPAITKQANATNSLTNAATIDTPTASDDASTDTSSDTSSPSHGH